MSSTGVTLSGSFSGATGDTRNWGFQWGTSSSSLSNRVFSDGLSAGNTFTYSLGSLSPGTTYYYRAIIEEKDGTTGSYVDRVSSEIKSFTTSAEAAVSVGYLGCYEVPSVTISGTGTSGYYNTDNDPRDDKWYRYNTSSSTRKVVTHTFTGSSRVRNYTLLFDSSKHAPLWAAFPMHANVYGGTTNRSDDWINDPAISSGQQSGLDNASTVGYSRGHLVASQYRKKNDASNLQTFYYANQAPQWQNGFNSGVWSTLETKVLNASPSNQSDTLYVVVGVLYEEDYYSAHSDFPRTLPSGSTNIPIPTHFYTCLMKCSFSGSTITAAQGIAFVYPNVSHTGENYYASEYITNIDDIETRAGFDFFPQVPSDLQTTAEKNKDARWFEPNASAPASTLSKRR